MTDRENDHRHTIALFRYGLIADLVHTVGTKGVYRRLEEKAAGDYTIPGSARTRIAPETLRDWLKRYRQGGFEALMPKPRADRGRSRALTDAVVELLLSLKETNPKLSVPAAHPRSPGHRPDPRGALSAIVHRAPPPRPPRPDAQDPRATHRARPPPVRLCQSRRAVDE